MTNDSLQKKQNPLQKAVKAGTALILAASMIFGFTACGNFSDNPGTGTETPPQETTEPQLYDIDYSKHSELFRQLLENREYQDIMCSSNFDTTIYSHPFAFLESRGHDVSSIISGEIKCKTFMFVSDTIPDYLYIATCVADPGNTYYTEYLVRYHLTEQEMKDFKSLFFNYDKGCFDNAVFLPDAVSRLYLGREQLCSHAKMGIKGNEKLNESLCDKPSIKKLTGAENNIAVLARFDNSNNSFGCYILPNIYAAIHNANSVKRRGKVTYIECQHHGPNFIRSTDDIFAIGDGNGKYLYFDGNYAITPGNSMDVTLYSTDGAELTNTTYRENAHK